MSPLSLLKNRNLRQAVADYSLTSKLIGLMVLTAVMSLFLATTLQAVNEGHSYRNNIRGGAPVCIPVRQGRFGFWR